MWLILRSAAVLIAGAVLGAAYLDSVWLGLLIGLLVSMGLFVAFEARKGKNPGRDEGDDGARL
ncbi:hypothetical protein [Microbacterium marinilacus]|uniref:DUF4229 domain-containing protein n=1 Tax=Microbacterium marinilacus TaxID=415209 RepID=A0ABP7BGS9_9MICO|nr:hypothetical protein [Microbacterium marinilacus]MBY0689630.1 hypothetical protein [Microbacterium marinilacus]